MVNGAYRLLDLTPKGRVTSRTCPTAWPGCGVTMTSRTDNRTTPSVAT